MSGAFSSCPLVKLQLAPDSRWEEALILTDCSEAGKIFAELVKMPMLAFGLEAFFMSDEAEAFVGVRLPALPAALTAARQFAENFTAGSTTVGDFENFASKAAAAPVFTGEPEFFELGLVNRWLSSGPLTYRTNLSSAVKRLSYEVAYERRWQKNLPAAAALELGWTRPVPHWLGLPASIKKNDGCYLNFTFLEKQLAKYNSDRGNKLGL